MTRGPAHVVARSLLGSSRAMREVRDAIARVAPLAMPVLVLGETGTGKELVARALHHVSGRTGPLVACNVAALSEALFEDALFGHERGAFSSAERQTDGLIAHADGGTLFLDEITALSMAMQPKLLRVLELGEYSRVGSVAVRRSRFRLIAASNESISACVEAGAFRADLAYRLRGTIIQLPPLRERREDIWELVCHFLAAEDLSSDRTLSEDALRELWRHEWPGNVRELRSVVQQAVLLAGSGPMLRWHVRGALDALSENVVALPTVNERRRRALQQLLDEHLDVERVAEILGRDVSTVYRQMRSLGIAPPKRGSGRSASRFSIRLSERVSGS